MPISVSSGHFALRYEVPKFLPRGGAFMYGYFISIDLPVLRNGDARDALLDLLH